MGKSKRFSLDNKSTCVSLIIKAPSDTPCSFPVERIDAFEMWLSNNAENWAYILHDLDTLDDGTPKRLHIHAWARLDTCQRLRTTLNSIADALDCDTEAIEVDKAVSMEGTIQYFTHQNQPDKAQYDKGQIKCNFDEKELDAILSADTGVFSLERIVSTCAKSRNLVEVIREIGLDLYEAHRNVIRDIWNSTHGRV